MVNTVADLLADPNSEKVYLVTVSPYSLDSSATESFYLSNGSYDTKPSDTPSSVSFLPVLVEIPSFRRSVEDILFGGILPVDSGKIVVADDGRFDNWPKRDKYIWGGYMFDVRLGGPNFEYSEFEVILTGIMYDIEYEISGGQRLITLHVGSKDFCLAQDLLQNSRYSSAPNSEIDGSVIPVCYGYSENITPVIYDEVNRVFQFNDGLSEDVVMVYDGDVDVVLTGTATAGASSTVTLDGSASSTDDEYNGAEITITGGTGNGQTREISDYVGATKIATVATSWTTNPDATSTYSLNLFTKDLTNGRFTLINQPTALTNITADVKGRKDSGGTYLESCAEIVEDALVRCAGISSGDLVASSFSSFPNTAPLQGYFKEEITIRDAINWFLRSVGGSLLKTILGKFELFRLDEPTGTATITLNENNIFSITREAYKPPVQNIHMGYRKNNSYRGGQIASEANVTDAHAAFISLEYRVAEPTVSGASSNYPLRENTQFIASAFTAESDAQDEADRRMGMFGVPSDIFSVKATANPFTRELGEELNVSYAGYDIASGTNMILVGFNPNISQGTIIDLALWVPNT